MAISRFSLDESLREDLRSGMTLLTPSYRLAASVLEAYGSGTGKQSWIEPRIVAVDVWLIELWETLASRGMQPFVELEILDSQLEKDLWLEAIESTRDAHPLIDASAMAQIAARAFQDLRRWSTDPLVHAMTPYLELEDVRIFSEWQARFERRCEELRRITLVQAVALLTQCVTQEIASLAGPLALLNFYSPPPNYRALFDALGQYGDIHRHYTLRRETLELDLSQLLDQSSIANARVEFADQKSEIEAVARWALERQRREPNAHIGLITPSPATVRPLIEQALLRVGDEHAALRLRNLPHLLNSSESGLALKDSALARDALIVLGLNLERQSLSDFCRLLRSPFIAGASDEAESRGRCERRLRDALKATTTRRAIAGITGDDSRSSACPLLHAAILESRTLQRGLPTSQSPRAWASLFRAQLAAFGFPGAASTRESAAWIRAWEACLDAFETSAEFVGPLTLNTALAALRRRVFEHRSPNHYRQQCSLSLYSPSEAAGMAFTHVWLLGFDDQSWPPPPHPNPLIPATLQRELGIPGSHAQSLFAAAQMDLATVCAAVSDSVTASHYTAGDDAEYRASNLIRGIPLFASGGQQSEAAHSAARTRSDSDAFEFVPDSRRRAVADAEEIRGGHSVLSHQSQCPFQAFAKARLQAHALEPIREGLDARERGNAVHWALEKFYAEIPDSAVLESLSESTGGQLAQRIDAAAEHALGELSKRFPDVMVPAFREVEKTRLCRLIERFVQRDSQRTAFSTTSPERRFHLTLEPLTLALKIDRIDTLSDGTTAVIDYKTGASVSAISALKDERPEEMQLPVYYTAVTRSTDLEVSALAIAQVHIESVDYHALARGENFDAAIEPLTGAKMKSGAQGERCAESDAASWREMTSGWEQLVDSLAAEFNSGECRVDPIASKTVCERCKLQSLCRITEIRGEVELDEEEQA